MTKTKTRVATYAEIYEAIGNMPMAKTTRTRNGRVHGGDYALTGAWRDGLANPEDFVLDTEAG